MAKNSSKSGYQLIFVFLVFGIFALTSVILLTLGASIYSNVLESTGNTDEMRSSLSYITNKIHSADRTGKVMVETHGELPVLSLKIDLAGEEYINVIYCVSGVIKEDLLEPGQAFDPERGEKILETAADFSVKQEGALITVKLGDLPALSVLLHTSV